jgi:predicted RNA-binding protein with PUA-like domain
LRIISILFYFFPKSKKENEKWTFLKMSKNQNPKKVLKMSSAKMGYKHNALISVFGSKNM